MALTKDAMVNAERQSVTVTTKRNDEIVCMQEISFSDVQVAAFALRQYVLQMTPAEVPPIPRAGAPA